MLFPNSCSEILRKALLFLESHRNFLRVGKPNLLHMCDVNLHDFFVRW